MNTSERVTVAMAWPAIAIELVLIGLRLGHVIGESWVWILSPLWATGATFLAVVAGFNVWIFVENRRVRRAERQYRPTARRYPS